MSKRLAGLGILFLGLFYPSLGFSAFTSGKRFSNALSKSNTHFARSYTQNNNRFFAFDYNNPKPQTHMLEYTDINLNMLPPLYPKLDLVKEVSVTDLNFINQIRSLPHFENPVDTLANIILEEMLWSYMYKQIKNRMFIHLDKELGIQSCDWEEVKFLIKNELGIIDVKNNVNKRVEQIIGWQVQLKGGTPKRNRTWDDDWSDRWSKLLNPTQQELYVYMDDFSVGTIQSIDSMLNDMDIVKAFYMGNFNTVLKNASTYAFTIFQTDSLELRSTLLASNMGTQLKEKLTLELGEVRATEARKLLRNTLSQLRIPKDNLLVSSQVDLMKR